MIMKELEPYHRIWLSNHPNRSEQWLKNCLQDGFDIHHLDGHHENNTPQNLVLIECQDHMALHGGKLNRLMNLRPYKAKVKINIDIQNMLCPWTCTPTQQNRCLCHYRKPGSETK